MTEFDDARALIEHAEAVLAKIKAAYDKSLHSKEITKPLLIEIKNFCENLRSALDFAAHGLFDTYGSSKKPNPKVYFPYALAAQTQAEFEKSGRIEQCIPGLTASRPDIVRLLLDMQHFGKRGYGWLPNFIELTNENKHQRLTPQTRTETRELKISSGGVSMSLGQGATMSIGRGATISIGGAVIPGGQTFDVNRPPLVREGRTEVITWVSFNFASNNLPVMPLLENALKGVREIVDDLGPN